MSTIPTLPSDRQLVGAVRGGSDAAWNELMGRHESPVRSVLQSRRERKSLTRRLADLRADIEREGDDDAIEGAPAIRAFRPRALAALSGGTYGPTPVDDHDHGDHGDHGDHDHDHDHGETGAVGPYDVSDAELLAAAFARLPEPWQTVLWHCLVEQLTAAEISPLVGRTTNDVADLVTTAERGLVDAFLLEYLAVGPLTAESERIVSMLGGYVRGTLPPHDQRLVDRHFSGDTTEPAQATADHEVASSGAISTFAPPVARTHTVDDSRRLVELIGSLAASVPPAIAPGITGLSVEAHRRALGTSNRTFGNDGLVEARSHRFGRIATVAAVAAVVLAIAGAAYLVRQPFDNDDTITADPSTNTSIAPAVPTTEPGDTSESSVPDTTVVASTTTEVLDLRPSPSGPASEIELAVLDGRRAVGLRQAATDLAVEVSSPAPIYAGGTGTIDLAIVNSGATTTEATAEFRLPSGLAFEALVSGAAECDDPAGGYPFCSFSVGAGETLDVAVRLRLGSGTVGRLVVDGEMVTQPLEASIVATRNLIHSSVGKGGVVTLGNTLMTCSDSDAEAIDIDCDAVRDGTSEFVNRWDVPMEFIGVAPQFGFENSSSATLDIPEGSTIAAAYLYWSGDLDERGQSIPDDGSNERVTVRGPNEEVVDVVADQLTLGDIDATQYLGSADVTDLVTEGGAGSYLVGNVQSVEVQGSYAAWSMVVVYDNVDEPRQLRVVTRPFDWVAPEPRFEYDVDLPVPVVSSGTAQLAVVAFEGERGFTPEALSVSGNPVGGDNVFDSTITGQRDPSYDNNLGFDLDVYDLTIDTADGTLPISATSEKDGIRIAVLALTVDLAS